MAGSSAWGSGIKRKSPQSIWLWRPVGLDFRSSTGLGETETPLLVACALGPRAKQWLRRSLGKTYLWVLEGLLGRQGSAVIYCRGKDTGGGAPREYSSAWALLEVIILAPRPGPTQQPSGSSAGMPQAKQPTGWEHSPTHRQTGCLKSSRAHSHLLTCPCPPESLHKPLHQPHPPGGRNQMQEELQSAACGMETTNTES